MENEVTNRTIPAPRGVSKELHEASLKVLELQQEVHAASGSLKQRRIELGRALWELKPKIPHGLWKNHLATYGVHYHTAKRSMRLVKNPEGDSKVPNQQRPFRQAPHNITAISHQNAKSDLSFLNPNDTRKGTISPFSDSGRLQALGLHQVEVALGVRSAPPADPDGLQPMTVEELEVYEASLPSRQRPRGKREPKGQMHFAGLYDQAKTRIVDAIDSLCSGLPCDLGARMRSLRENFLLAAEAILGGG